VSAAHILVSYKGGQRAKPTITRTKEEARTRAEEIRTMALAAGADFAALAKQYSDGPTGPRGGNLGIFGRGQMVAAFDNAVFSMPINGISEVVETGFGFHVIKRLPLPAEAVTQHIMVVWKGAKNAAKEITRSKDEARARANEAHAAATADGADWHAVVKKFSDDTGSVDRGGLAGRLVEGGVHADFAAIADAVFKMEPYAVSAVVETPYAFHVLRRAPSHKIRASHILVQYKGSMRARPTVTRTKEEARLRAEDLRVKAVAQGANFAQLARENSDGPSGPEGGDLREFGYEGMVYRFAEAAYRLAPGGISEVVETPFGFHVVMRTK
jgi:parvulin-like peptidyl-prolyl isomerase